MTHTSRGHDDFYSSGSALSPDSTSISGSGADVCPAGAGLDLSGDKSVVLLVVAVVDDTLVSC